MKKREKRIYAANALRVAIDDSMDRHPHYSKEYCTDGSCDDCERCDTAPFMISFYDHNHKKLVSNWLYNSFNCAGGCNQSSLIDVLSAYFDLDIAHLMWGGADEYLHRVRYIRIGERETIKDEDGYSANFEAGIEYDIYGKTMEQYLSKWYNEPELNAGIA